MPALLRYLSVTAAAGAAITLAAAAPAATAATGRAAGPAAPVASADVTASARPAARPGRTASPITLGSKIQRVTVHGPASFLPPVSMAAGVTGRPAAGWHVVSRALRLGRKTLHGKTLNGASLKAGKSYALHGRVTFADGGSRRSVTATLRFRSCPNS